MTICDANDESLISDEAINHGMEKRPNGNLHLIHQKLIIKHSKLKKLSLWGCSGLDVRLSDPKICILHSVTLGFLVLILLIEMQALYLNCPELNDLNLNACKNLLPGMFKQCIGLDRVLTHN